jgi:hypothetical protein
MIIVCSYCRNVIGEKEPLENKAFTHSICLACWDYHMPQMLELNLSEHLDTYESPVIMVDEEGRVIGINKAMAAFLNTTKEQSLGLLGGELLRCRYSCLPEGCGNTQHCATCSLRQTFTQSRVQKKDLLEVPASVDLKDQRLYFVISAYNRIQFVKVVVEKLVRTEPFPPQAW